MDVTLILGPYGATALLLYFLIEARKEIKIKDGIIEEQRREGLRTVEEYRKRDEEDRLWRQSLDRKRLESPP